MTQANFRLSLYVFQMVIGLEVPIEESRKTNVIEFCLSEICSGITEQTELSPKRLQWQKIAMVQNAVDKKLKAFHATVGY